MLRIRRDQLTYEFAPNVPPVATIEPGETVIFETYDASTGRIRKPEDLAAYLKVRDPRKVNPAAGPIFVRGARPGDELVVAIEGIELTDQGYIRAAPGGVAGGFRSRARSSCRSSAASCSCRAGFAGRPGRWSG